MTCKQLISFFIFLLIGVCLLCLIYTSILSIKLSLTLLNTCSFAYHYRQYFLVLSPGTEESTSICFRCTKTILVMPISTLPTLC